MLHPQELASNTNLGFLVLYMMLGISINIFLVITVRTDPGYLPHYKVPSVQTRASPNRAKFR